LDDLVDLVKGRPVQTLSTHDLKYFCDVPACPGDRQVPGTRERGAARHHPRYTAFVKAGQREAGPQTTAAWNAMPITADAQLPSSVGYDRTDSDKARYAVIAAMKTDLTKLN
jgi:hypothetical protein